jgi:hypothetical protein
LARCCSRSICFCFWRVLHAETAREALILSQGGAEVKSYSSAGQAVLLLVIVPAYGMFASRVSRVRLVTGVMLFFASNLAVFTTLAREYTQRSHPVAKASSQQRSVIGLGCR